MRKRLGRWGKEPAARLFFPFYSSRFPKNLRWIEKVVPALEGDDAFELHPVDIDKDTTLWQKLGLRSVPTSVVFRDDVARTNSTAYLSPDQIRELVRDAKNDEGADETASKRTELHEAVSHPQRPLRFMVTASSGTHRYERWNEQSLASNGIGSGWTAPSRKTPQLEYVECSFSASAALSSIWFRPRHRTDGIPSWKSFPRCLVIKTRSTSGEFWTVWEGQSSRLLRCGEFLVVRFAQPIEAQTVRIEVVESHDIAGKSFPGFRSITFDGASVEGEPCGATRIDSRLLEDYSSSEMTKHGLIAEAGLSAECINLGPEQETPKSFANKTKLLSVRHGAIEVSIDGHPPITAAAGDILSITAGCAWSMRGLSAKNSVLVAFNGQDLDSVWEAR